MNIARGYKLNLEIIRSLYSSQDAPLSTGLDELDELLDGGFKPYYSYLIYGEAATYKTRLITKTIKKAISYSNVNILVFSYKEDIYHNISDILDKKESGKTIRYLKITDITNLNEIVDEITKLPKKWRILVIDDFNHIINQDSTQQKREILTLVWKVKNLVYRWGASLIIITGITQKPGIMGQYIPRGFSRIAHIFNYILLTSKLEEEYVRISDIMRAKSVIIKVK